MEIEFPYIIEKANIVPLIQRPVARVTMINGDKKVIQDMYVDSGADIALIPFSVGKVLEFEIKKDEDIKRIGGGWRFKDFSSG